MNVWCMGCGEEHPLDPVDVVGLGVLMLCEQCYSDLCSPDEVDEVQG